MIPSFARARVALYVHAATNSPFELAEENRSRCRRSRG
jgi:hypothetical protein